MIKLTLIELQTLLDKQKQITVEKCLGHSYYYNKESTDSMTKSLPIDEEKFRQQGMKASYPEEFNVLKKYLKN